MSPLRSLRTWTNGRVVPHYSADRFDRLGADHGTLATWWTANLCPCRGQRSSAPNLDCPRCRGYGWFWTDPITGNQQDTSDNTKKIADTFGQFMPGDLMVSMSVRPSGTRTLAGVGDRFYFPERIEIHQDRKTKGMSRPDAETAERIFSPAVASVHGCYSVRQSFVLGADFELIPDANGNGSIISWIAGGNRPDEGEDYTIKYEAAVFYHVAEVQFRTEHNQRMPQKLLCRKAWTPSDLAIIGAQTGATGQGSVE